MRNYVTFISSWYQVLFSLVACWNKHLDPIKKFYNWNIEFIGQLRKIDIGMEINDMASNSFNVGVISFCGTFDSHLCIECSSVYYEKFYWIKLIKSSQVLKGLKEFLIFITFYTLLMLFGIPLYMGLLIPIECVKRNHKFCVQSQ